MDVTTEQLLPPDVGITLPQPVRSALVDMGIACNQAAIAVTQAYTIQMQMVAASESIEARQQPHGLHSAVTQDLSRSADTYHAQLVVVLARAATTYAVYASQVAAAVAAHRTPPTPDPAVIRPSDVITALDLYLPEICFTADHGEPRVVAEQNADIAQTRKILTDLITHQLKDEPGSGYDDPAHVASEHGGSHDVLVGFPVALHAYAATLVWATGAFSGVAADSSTDSPGTA